MAENLTKLAENLKEKGAVSLVSIIRSLPQNILRKLELHLIVDTKLSLVRQFVRHAQTRHSKYHKTHEGDGHQGFG